MALSRERAAEALAQQRVLLGTGTRPNDAVQQLAAQHGVTVETMCRYLRLARKQEALEGDHGFAPVLEGFEISKTTAVLDQDENVVRQFVTQRPEHGEAFEVPAGHTVKGVSALLDPDGREIIKWVKTREGELTPEAIVETLKASLADLPPAEPVVLREHGDRELLTLYPCNDWHIGMFAWGRETERNWDTKIAERTIGNSMRELILRSPPSAQAVILVGGDLLHADSQENRTAKSGNALDVDGRFQKVVAAANRLLVHTIGWAAGVHERVLVRVLKGNHDEHAAIAAAHFLQAYYRDEPRVVVDTDPSLFWWHRFGQVMLGSTHGHTIKPEQMAGIMAARRPEWWGETKHRYAHTFHLHHKRVIAHEEGGVMTEVHQAPIPQDAWHYGAGYLSGRSLQSITYHKDHGEIGRVRISMLDS